ncbi:MAG: thioredoxin family protein [Planctomycetales bacterium]|nr:thioredoxin family protein [Planctomycetales bacterium]
MKQGLGAAYHWLGWSQFVTGCVFALIVCWPAPRSIAGEFNPTLNILDTAPAWEKLPGVDGNEHALSDLKDVQVIVVVFTCNSCPYAVDHEQRLIALSKQYVGKPVRLIAVNVNKVDEDALEAMKVRATDKGFNFTYLFDESQQIARDFGATYTPEFFVLNKQRQVIYMGAMDDSPSGQDVKVHYVEQAIEAALRGELPEIKETVAIGCGIRYVRARRKPR